MRVVYQLLALLTFSRHAWTHSLEARSRVLNTTAALALPQCVTACATRILPELHCDLLDPATGLPSDCYCASSGPVADGLSACVLSDCPHLSQALEGLKFQAVSCDYPRNRNTGPAFLGITLALFSTATLFLIARFLSRWPRLQGAGLSWDDGKIALRCCV